MVSLEMRVAFDLGEFVKADLVAPTCVGGGQESLDHFESSRGSDDTGAEGEDVGVVMLASKAGGEYVVSQGGTDAGDSVGGDGNSDAGTADGDTEIRLS
jgi:hypothetical protein